jgi:hypothetical protein
MSKAVLISIRPEWCEKIINGQKTIEVRKTRPKMDTPFKCYIRKELFGFRVSARPATRGWTVPPNERAAV